jgi:hypothetical protein
VYYDSNIRPVFIGNDTIEDEFKVITGSNITNLTDAHRDTGLIREKNGLERNSFQWPLWTGKAFINTTSIGETDPVYFEKMSAKMPWQSVPNNTKDTFSGWDTRFETGYYSLS